MVEAPERTTRLTAEVALPIGSVKLIEQSWTGPIDSIAEAADHWLELALLPLSDGARCNFPLQWGPHRFEPVGPLFLVPAGHRMHAISDCRRQSSIVCAFRPDAVEAWLGTPIDWSGHRLHRALDLAHPRLAALLRRLGAEVGEPGFAGAAMVELIAAQIALELARHAFSMEEGACRGGLAPWRLRRIDERLADLCDMPSLDELAVLCGCSVRQLTRGFRVSRGCSIGDHVAARRIEHAKRLLAREGSIAAVAGRLGFASPTVFATAFRRATGTSPRDYRARAGRLH